ncbi:MAG: geranylgeranylglyceryl/heptaprenylglyceryl phosphate synthase [Flavobacteriia bacterium]|jgi:phosphoglycerol geranylgeranyltransferase
MDKTTEHIYSIIKSSDKGIAVLIDPEKCDNGPQLRSLLEKAAFAGINFLFVGGSTVSRQEFVQTVKFIKENTSIPVVIFPGSSQQLSPLADAILYLSLLSGRNPDFLIGHHVQSAMELFEMDIEVIPTAYLLIDGGTQSSVAYVSQTTPIPRNKINIVKNTALAGKLQGKRIVYLDAGSGAKEVVPAEMIRHVASLDIPVIIGGGLRTIDTIKKAHDAGASLVVIGNHLEQNTDLLLDIHTYKTNGTTLTV